METALNSPSKTEKKTWTKLMRFKPSIAQRLLAQSAVHSCDVSEIIERGTIRELDMLESQTAVEANRLTKLKAIAAAKGLEVDQVIDHMFHQATEPELPMLASKGAA